MVSANACHVAESARDRTTSAAWRNICRRYSRSICESSPPPARCSLRFGASTVATDGAVFGLSSQHVDRGVSRNPTQPVSKQSRFVTSFPRRQCPSHSDQYLLSDILSIGILQTSHPRHVIDDGAIDPRKLLPRTLIAWIGDPNEQAVSRIWNVLQFQSSGLRTQVEDYSDR